MKLLKHKHFMSLIYSVLVALPFFAILGRVIYTQSNHNAFESYSNVMSMQPTKQTNNTMIEKESYIVSYKEGNSITQYSPIFYYNSISIDWSDYSNYTNSQVNGFRFYPETIGQNGYIILFYDENNVGITRNIWGITLNSITFTYKSNNAFNNYQPNFNLYLLSYETSKLDNAFEYSLSTFIDDNNFGNLDFFSWFSNIFLDTSNTHNMLYINFINWYLNYTLFISLAYVLFLVLMWFVSFVRRLLENTQNMNIGGL